MIPRLYVPVTAPEDVVRHLGKQEKHWKQGRSAHSLASLWFKYNDFPPRIRQALDTADKFRSAELIDAFFERQVDLQSKGRPSQTDLLAIAGIEGGIAVFGIEGKAGETFGDCVSVWHDGSETKRARLAGLGRLLNLRPEACGGLRYQLLHRAASVILEAKRYRTTDAVLLIHSFCRDEKGFADFSIFLEALGFDRSTAGTVVGPVDRDGVRLYASWVDDEPLVAETPTSYLNSLRAYAEQTKSECDRVRTWCDAQLSASSKRK